MAYKIFAVLLAVNVLTFVAETQAAEPAFTPAPLSDEMISNAVGSDVVSGRKVASELLKRFGKRIFSDAIASNSLLQGEGRKVAGMLVNSDYGLDLGREKVVLSFNYSF